MKKKPRLIIHAPCRRGCGTMLASMNQSVNLHDDLRKKYQFICINCLKPEEREELENALPTWLGRVKRDIPYKI